MFTIEQEKIIKNVVKSVIFQIRKGGSVKTGGVYDILYTYHISDFSQQLECNKIEIKHNYECFKLQIQRKLLSQCNNYWKLKDSELRLIEESINKKEFENFKPYIEYLWNCNLKNIEKEIELEEENKISEKNEKIKKILGNKYESYKDLIPAILESKREYPYKSDKIKIFLDLYLNSDEIFRIMNNYEQWRVTYSYVEKYRIERMDLIKEGKKKIYDKDYLFKSIRNKLNYLIK